MRIELIHKDDHPTDFTKWYLYHCSDGDDHALVEVMMPMGNKFTKSADKMDRAAAKTARGAWTMDLQRDYRPYVSLGWIKANMDKLPDDVRDLPVIKEMV